MASTWTYVGVDEQRHRGPGHAPVRTGHHAGPRTIARRAHARRMAGYEDQTRHALVGLFRRQAKATLNRLGGRRGRQMLNRAARPPFPPRPTGAADAGGTGGEAPVAGAGATVQPGAIFDPNYWANETAGVLADAYRAPAANAISTADSSLDETPSREYSSLATGAVNAALRTRAQTVGAQITQTTYNQIADQLQQGIALGEDANQLGRRVEAVFAEAGKTRADTIARTEANSANNMANNVYANNLPVGMVSGREWLAVHDERTRTTHRLADGQRQPVGVPFNVGGAMLMHPGDPTGPPDEVINCRCTTTLIPTSKSDTLLTAKKLEPGPIRSTELEQRVGPHGYIHNWIFVGVPGIGDVVFHPRFGHGHVTDNRFVANSPVKQHHQVSVHWDTGTYWRGKNTEHSAFGVTAFHNAATGQPGRKPELIPRGPARSDAQARKRAEDYAAKKAAQAPKTPAKERVTWNKISPAEAKTRTQEYNNKLGGDMLLGKLAAEATANQISKNHDTYLASDGSMVHFNNRVKMTEETRQQVLNKVADLRQSPNAHVMPLEVFAGSGRMTGLNKTGERFDHGVGGYTVSGKPQIWLAPGLLRENPTGKSGAAAQSRRSMNESYQRAARTKVMGGLWGDQKMPYTKFMPQQRVHSAIDYTLTHEHGHAIDYALSSNSARALLGANAPSEEKSQSVFDTIKAQARDRNNGMSGYARTKAHEMTAEAFAEYELSGGKTTTPGAQTIAKAEGWKPNSLMKFTDPNYATWGTPDLANEPKTEESRPAFQPPPEPPPVKTGFIVPKVAR